MITPTQMLNIISDHDSSLEILPRLDLLHRRMDLFFRSEVQKAILSISC